MFIEAVGVLLIFHAPRRIALAVVYVFVMCMFVEIP
jgi:hypothetical protein